MNAEFELKVQAWVDGELTGREERDLVGRRLAPLAPQLRVRRASDPSASNEG